MTPKLSVVGIDLAKSIFHLVGLDERGTIILRKRLARGEVRPFAQFLAVCSSYIRAETLGYAVSFSSPWCGKHRVFEWRKPVLMDQLQPSTNADNLSEALCSLVSI